MRIAVPTAQGSLSPHFGHCEEFTIFQIDLDACQIKEQQSLTPPPHAPGGIPQWLNSHDVKLVIAGGIRPKAIAHFQAAGIEVINGVPVAPAEELVNSYLNGELVGGANLCDHSGPGGCKHKDGSHRHG
jgi:predicted Fe-Mo cluster-binding NifX family protein